MKSGRILTGTIFVLLGIVLFLNNVGLLTWAVWARLVYLWPVLIIALGLKIAFPRGILGLLPAIVVIVAVIFAMFFPEYFPVNGGPRVSVINEQSLETTIDRAVLGFKLGASRIEIKTIDDYDGDKMDKLYVAELRHIERYAPEVKYEKEGNVAIIDMTSPSIRGFSIPWFSRDGVSLANDIRLWLNPSVEWSFDLDLGASKLDMDLSRIPMQDISIGTGASDIHLKFGSKIYNANVQIRAGASNVKLSVPRELGVKVVFDAALSNNNLGDVGFSRSNNEYVSSNYDSADKFLNIEFSSGVSNFRLDWI